ncbi:bifunctional acetate--CoA ligase family protein/GNAT family N-acetyltransferase [Streptomyces sp. CMB-StM0423]|uniref:bifunctional acetate--CoA ligase family protein/GNAT family N-acetyltransferase n=1 Tax=Streptomyces sp. CMB-StM0423 TaxID=2059884 RepID=UPI000C71577C|nr:GNAT family N-acetyltransferase [Streptomyces sp. CMB-StM0423]AUH40077.1 acyl-CoA synthetase [Streptomyces sp. CMB-StM0423]
MATPSAHEYPTHWEADVVLRDGGTAQVRPIVPDDADRLVAFFDRVSDESKYLRFFAPHPRLSARDVHRFTHHDYVDRVGLAAVVGDAFIATVRYDRIEPAADGATQAEVAFLVQDDQQGRGVASVLLEHIAACARERGVRRFVADVLPANSRMMKVFTDAGYTQKRSFEDGVVRLEFELEPTERSLAVMHAREQRAEARSVQRLLAPRSVAVIGVGRRPGGVGRTVLANLLAAGFTGRLYAVNHAYPEGRDRLLPEDVPARRSVRDIDEPVDLAVVAVPAARVPDVVDDCGEQGVQGLVVLSSGYAEAGAAGRARQRDLVRQARGHGMRVIGPNAFGVLNTAPPVRLNATLAPEPAGSGRVGVFTQSGAIGIALLSGLHRRPGAVLTGVSTFVSAGNRADVSGNDLLQYWHDDAATDVVLMYLESLGNPRKFTRLARRTAAVKPVVVVKGARHSASTPPGHAVPGTSVPAETVGALLRQAGVVAVDTVTELVDTGLLLAAQPLPAGPRVAIVGNSDSLGLLAYDACRAAGLRPLPPRDLTAAAAPEDFRAAVAAALAEEGCDAVLVTAIPWVADPDVPALAAVPGPQDAGALADALRTAAAGATKPVAVVHLEIEGLPGALAAPPDGIPTYPAGERAARALAQAVRYAQWRRRAADPGRVPEYDDLDTAGAAADIAGLLGERSPAAGAGDGVPPDWAPGGAWQPAEGEGPAGRSGAGAAGPGGTAAGADGAAAAGGPAGAAAGTAAAPAPYPEGVPVDVPEQAAARVLRRYGINVLPALPAPDPDAAAAAAARLGYPVALKTTAVHLRHRPDLGGVRLDLAGEDQLRLAHTELTGTLGAAAEVQPVVQAMAPRGVDTVVRATVDPGVGAVLSFGLAGAPSELLGDLAHRLVPATDRDAAELIRAIRGAPLLFGWRGAQPVDTAALEELLLRLSIFVDEHPEVVSAELSPVVVAPQGVSVLSAALRLAPPPPRIDLGARRMPRY